MTLKQLNLVINRVPLACSNCGGFHYNSSSLSVEKILSEVFIFPISLSQQNIELHFLPTENIGDFWQIGGLATNYDLRFHRGGALHTLIQPTQSSLYICNVTILFRIYTRLDTNNVSWMFGYRLGFIKVLRSFICFKDLNTG